MAQKCDFCLLVPSVDTPRIQESHIFAWHYICGAVEQALFPHEP
jgi:D-sedoheptulose 7-phosphate isomerase